MATATPTPPIPPISSTTTASIVAASQSLSNKVGRPVTISSVPGVYPGWCERGASAGAGTLTGKPSVTKALGANAWESRTKYADTKLWNAASAPIPTSGLPNSVRDQINSAVPGTVLCFRDRGGGPGHTMIYIGDNTWMSDNTTDDPNQFIANTKYDAVSIVTPNVEGTNTIAALWPGLAPSTGSIKQYTASPSNNSDGSATGGLSFTTGTATQATTPDQLITINDQYFSNLPSGASVPATPLATLQARAKQPYSNRQFVSPISLKVNVEGFIKDMDFLQKSISTNGYNPYKRNIVLSINQGQVSRNSINVNTATDRKTRTLTLKYGTPGIPATNSELGSTIATGAGSIAGAFLNQHDVTQSVFNAGNNAITQTLGGRIPSLTSLVGGNVIANTAVNAVQQIPGVSNLTGSGGITGILANPVGAVTGALTSIIKIQANPQLPSQAQVGDKTDAFSASLGSLPKLFSTASSIAAGGPPTSITGALQIEQQIKELACTFVLPFIHIPPIKDLLKLKISFKEIADQIKHELQAIEQKIKDFFSYENLKKLLEDLIPDPNELLKAVYNQLFKCADSPASKKADLSGKSDTNQKALNTPGGLPAAAAASNVIYASTHASATNFGIK